MMRPAVECSHADAYAVADASRLAELPAKLDAHPEPAPAIVHAD